MSIFANIGPALSAAWGVLEGKVSAEIKAAENSVILFYKDLMASTAAHGPQYVQTLKDAAKAAVTAAAALPGNGAAKAAAAFASVAGVLTTEGLPIIENDIKGAVEAAYASFIAAQTPATSAPASK